jgi:hypothetical protein
MHVQAKGAWFTAAATGLAVLATQLLAGAPAAAATLPLGTVTAFTAQSPFDTRAEKSFTVSCPDGQRVTGGGAFTVGGIHAVITEMRPVRPTSGPDFFQVSAAADQFGIAGSWSFQVFAFCAVAPASAAVEIVPSARQLFTGNGQAGATCPAGKVLIGTGGLIEGGRGQMDLGMFPNSSGTLANGSAAFAKVDADGFSGQYALTGYSVCARPNDLLNDFQLVRRLFRTATNLPSQTATVACPSGMALTGLGGATVLPGTHLQQIRPTVAGGRLANLATVGAQSSVPPTEAWDLDVSLFCAR